MNPGGVNPAERRLLPQAAVNGKTVRRSADWIFEPHWSGDRLIAFVADDDVSLVDYMGERAGSAFADVGTALRAAVRAGQAVVDVVWVDSWMPAASPEDRVPVVVAVDLLELDDQSLLDVPLLERRRLLEAIIEERPDVRVTPAVRAPVEPSMNAWRAQGFRACVAKHANSRYLPGERNADWIRISIEHLRPAGMSGMLIGAQTERGPQIKP